jgi:alginate O-acetyltransferase complex protein AlgI
MHFVSFNFLAFLLLTLIIYYALPRGLRSLFLLAASFLFYTFLDVKYALVLAFVIAIGFLSALLIAKTPGPNRKRCILIGSSALLLGILFIFKYYSFFIDSLSSALHILHLEASLPEMNIILPVGLSFYSLVTLGYLTDVYRGEVAPERNLKTLALFISFFPLVTSGPIERSSRILPQIHSKPAFDQTLFLDGLKLMLWGYFKKVVIADNLGAVVDRVYGNVGAFDGPSFIAATIFFTLQIFADFSGYTDIAIGAAQTFGFRTTQNFDRPYYAVSISDFWKRWHISLSTWLRDYLYIPVVQTLQSRIGVSRTLIFGIRSEIWIYAIGVLVTFFLCGLWHGANWSYVAWGMIHGFYLIIGRVSKDFRENMARRIGLTSVPRLYRLLKITTTFSLVSFAWIFFRSNTLPEAWHIVTHLFSGTVAFLATVTKQMFFFNKLVDGEFIGIVNLEHLSVWLHNLAIEPLPLATTIIGLMVMELVHFFQPQRGVVGILDAKPLWVRWALCYFILFYISMFGKFDIAEFLYGRF